MLIARNAAGTHHLVSVNAPSTENPGGFHRLVGGSVAAQNDSILATFDAGAAEMLQPSDRHLVEIWS